MLVQMPGSEEKERKRRRRSQSLAGGEEVYKGLGPASRALSDCASAPIHEDVPSSLARLLASDLANAELWLVGLRS
jgi:hypothetical protein